VAPGHAKFSHRTQTVDYDIVLSGEIDLILDDGEVVHLRTGDVIILRGGTHTWHNTAAVPAVTAFILVDALPVSVDHEILEPLFPAEPGLTF
jgi:quercetin dioxygenase-like cupin family protein